MGKLCIKRHALYRVCAVFAVCCCVSCFLKQESSQILIHEKQKSGKLSECLMLFCKYAQNTFIMSGNGVYLFCGYKSAM